MSTGVNSKKSEYEKLKAKGEMNTKDVQDALTTYGYYLNKLIEETKRVSTKDYGKLRKVLLTYTDKQIQTLKTVDSFLKP